MTARCTDLDLFFDGELDTDQSAAFRDHLVTCERCQRVLHGRMQEEVAAQADQPADAIPIAIARAARAAAAGASAASAPGASASTASAPGPSASAASMPLVIASGPSAAAGSVAVANPSAAGGPGASSSSEPAPSRGSRRGVLVYLAPILAAAAAVPLFLLGKRDEGPLEIALEIEHSGPTARGPAHVGDILHSTVRGEQYRALWVYFEDHELVAACPNDARCSNDGSDMVVRLTLKQRGRYTVVAVGSDDAIPPPAPGATLDEQLAGQSARIHNRQKRIEVD